MIQSNAIYSTEDLRKLGIGTVALAEARRAKALKPKVIGKSLWYAGKELIEWFEQQPVKEKQ